MDADEEEIEQRTETARRLKESARELKDRMDRIETLKPQEEEDVSQLCNEFGDLSAEKNRLRDRLDQLTQLAASSRWAASATAV